MHTNYKPKKRRTDINLGSVFCKFKDNIKEYIIIHETEDEYTLESSHTGTWFNTPKDTCYKTKDDLKYGHFCNHCFNLLAGKHGNGSKMDIDIIKSQAEKRMKKFLGNTKQIEYRERFFNEFAEYAI